MSFNNPDHSRELYLFDHFLCERGDTNWTRQQTSGGGITSVGVTNKFGVIKLSLGTASSSRASIRGGTAGMSFGTGEYIFTSSQRLVELSTSGTEYIATMGFFDSTTIDATNGAYFEYDRVSAGNFWRTCTSINSTRTKTTTNIPVTTGNFQTFSIQVHPTGQFVNFYVNNSLVSQHTTNIPTGNNDFNYSLVIRKMSGSSVITGMDVDFILIRGQVISGIYL